MKEERNQSEINDDAIILGRQKQKLIEVRQFLNSMAYGSRVKSIIITKLDESVLWLNHEINEHENSPYKKNSPIL